MSPQPFIAPASIAVSPYASMAQGAGFVDRPLPVDTHASTANAYPVLAGEVSPRPLLLQSVNRPLQSPRHMTSSALQPSASGQTVLHLEAPLRPTTVNKLEPSSPIKPVKPQQEEKTSFWQHPLKSPWLKGGLIMGAGWALGFTGQVAGFECVLIALAGLASTLILMNGFEAHQKVKAVSRELHQESAPHLNLDQRG